MLIGARLSVVTLRRTLVLARCRTRGAERQESDATI